MPPSTTKPMPRNLATVVASRVLKGTTRPRRRSPRPAAVLGLLVLLITTTLASLAVRSEAAPGDATGEVSITDVSRPEGDADQAALTFTVTFKCTQNSRGVPQVGVQQVDYETVADGAAAGEDYVAASGTLSFDFGTPPTQICLSQSISKPVSVKVNGDTKTENSEKFFLDVTPHDETVAPARGTGTIVNDDGPTMSIADAAPLLRPSAGAAPMTFWVTLSEPAPDDVTFAVDYQLLPGTDPATSAEGGQDYAALTGASDSGVPRAATVKFPPGETRVPINVAVYGNTFAAADRTFRVQLSNSDVKGIARGLATGTIRSDNPVASLRVSDAWVTEGTAASPTHLVFTLSLPPPYSAQAVSVDYATADGDATAAQDYTATVGTVTLDPFVPSANIRVPVTADSAAELNETLSLVLSKPVHATLARAEARGTIGNDDGKAFVFSGLGATPVSGAAQTVTVTAKQSFASGAPTDTTFVGTPTLSAPDDAHFTPGTCGAAVLGVSTCTGVVFGDLGPQRLVAAAGSPLVEPNGTTLAAVQPTGLTLEAASATVHAGFPLRLTARPTAGVAGASIDEYRAPRSLTVAEGRSVPVNGSALSCPDAVCRFDVAFRDPGSPRVQVSDRSQPIRTSGALTISVTEATAPPPGRPAGELPFPLVGKVDLFDPTGARVPDGITAQETTVNHDRPPQPQQIASLMAVDPGLRLLLATGRQTQQISVVNLDSLIQVRTIQLGFKPTFLLVDATRHLAFASNGATLATVQLGSDAPVRTFTLPLSANEENVGLNAFALSPARGVLYALINGPGGVVVHAYDETTLASTDLAQGDQSADLWPGGYALAVNRCPATLGGLGLSEPGSFLYFYCYAAPANAAEAPARHGRVARVEVPDNGDAPCPTCAAFFPWGGIDGNTRAHFLSPLDGRLTFFGRAGGGEELPIPVHAVMFDAGHGAFLGRTQLASTGSLNGAASSAERGRNYRLASTQFVRANDPVTFQPVKILAPTILTVSSPGRLPADNGLNHTVLDGAFPSRSVLPGGKGSPAQAAYDPVTRRLFMFGSGYTRPTDRFDGDRQVVRIQSSHPVFVFEDRLPDPPATVQPDPDADTHDDDEIPGRTPTSFAAGASAYGAARRTIGWTPGMQGAPDTIDKNDHLITSALVSLSGLSDSGAVATAVGTALDPETAKQFEDATGGSPVERPDQFVQSRCGDFDGKATTDSKQGSSVACDLAATSVRAAASEDPQSHGPPIGADEQVQVGSTASWTSLTRDPVKGSVARAEAVARDITIGGVLHIGEVHSVATSVANGRKGKAESTFTATLRNVALTDANDPSGKPLFTCEVCSPTTVADAVNNLAGTNLEARAGAPDPNPLVKNSPGGAQAAIQKAPYNYWHDFYSYGDETQEVYGLQVYLDRDSTLSASHPHGLLLELAGVAADAHYVIGLTPPEPEVVPGSLAIKLFDGLADDVPPGAPLAGGVFEVYADADGDGSLGAADTIIRDGSCVTGADGTGTCLFAGLAPGKYVVHEKSPPPGWAGAPDAPATVEPGTLATLEFFNPRAIARVAVVLTDDAKPPNPLAGGVFELYADDGDGALGVADTLRGSCTTDAAGKCPEFLDMPLGKYVVREKTPPAGYLGAPDAAFALTLPGSLTTSTFVNPKAVGAVVVAVGDDNDPPNGLAGGVFELYADDGDGALGAADVLRGSCTSDADGFCPPFLDVPLGKYVVHEKTAPPGYAGAPDAAFALTRAGEVGLAIFLNPKAVGVVEVSVADDATPPKPLAGGVFELYADDGDGKLGAADVLRSSCTTDAAGKCPEFLDVPLGAYVVHEKTAPAGYAPADDSAFSLTKVDETARVAFVNPKAVGRIEVSLTDAAEPPKPLAGGVFELFADADGNSKLGAADRKVGSCTTDAAGKCSPFLDVPLGNYTVHQNIAPAGYVAADDAAFELTKPGETVEVAFVDGTPGTEAVPATVATSAPATDATPGTPAQFIPGEPAQEPTFTPEVVVLGGQDAPEPIVSLEPDVAAPAGLGQQFFAPAESAWRLLARTPMQALLVGLVWLLLGLPAYLGTRRHRLSLIRQGI